MKELADEVAPALSTLFQASLDTGIVPADWRTTLDTPVFKKGERYKPENYRPISLTCIPCKLLEHIVVSHIMKYCEKHKILCEEQHGFRSGHSCESQLLGFVDEVTEELERGHQVDLLVMDFSKAFDKVSHSLLVNKLQHYGISGTTNRWITSFLAGRRQAVVVNGTASSYAPVESGVPQGSVLGPSLFLLYINDLPSNLTATARLFADDTACHQTILSTANQDSLQQDLDKMATWEDKWKMEFHPKKCSTVHISKSQPSKHSYTLRGHTLAEETDVKYLGVTLSNDLKWNRHVTNICSKANKTLGFLRRNLRISNPKVKRMAYQAMVRPILEYSSPVWDPYTADLVDTLEKVQRRATRWICNRYRQTSSVDDMLINLEMPTLASRRKDARLVTFFKFHNKLTNINSKFLPSQSVRRRSQRRFNAQSYNIPSNRTEYRQKSFFPRTIPDWNALPNVTVHVSTVDAFKQRLHK